MTEKFWLNDIKELYIKNQFIKFIPKCDGSMTKVEQINAITRLSLYLIVLIFIFDTDRNYNLLCLPLALITIGVVYYNLVIRYKNNIIEEEDEDEKIKTVFVKKSLLD